MPPILVREVPMRRPGPPSSSWPMLLIALFFVGAIGGIAVEAQNHRFHGHGDSRSDIAPASAGRVPVAVYSPGEDGIAGTDDDVRSWE